MPKYSSKISEKCQKVPLNQLIFSVCTKVVVLLGLRKRFSCNQIVPPLAKALPSSPLRSWLHTHTQIHRLFQLICANSIDSAMRGQNKARCTKQKSAQLSLIAYIAGGGVRQGMGGEGMAIRPQLKSQLHLMTRGVDGSRQVGRGRSWGMRKGNNLRYNANTGRSCSAAELLSLDGVQWHLHDVCNTRRSRGQHWVTPFRVSSRDKSRKLQ